MSGREENGVLQFEGTFTSISWTNTAENYYGFTIGVVPEPTTGALVGLGLSYLSFCRRSERASRSS